MLSPPFMYTDFCFLFFLKPNVWKSEVFLVYLQA